MVTVDGLHGLLIVKIRCKTTYISFMYNVNDVKLNCRPSYYDTDIYHQTDDNHIIRVLCVVILFLVTVWT